MGNLKIGGQFSGRIAVVVPQEQHLPILRRKGGQRVRQSVVVGRGDLHAMHFLVQLLRPVAAVAAEHVQGLPLYCYNDVGAGLWTVNFVNF